MKGVIINIFRSDLGDCTLGGVTSPNNAKDKTFVVFDKAIRNGNFDYDKCKDDARYVCLCIRRRRVGGEDYMNLEPIDPPNGDVDPMSGGNFGYTCDSRFRRVSEYPLSIHDRFETAA